MSIIDPENLTSAKVFSDPPMNIAEINKSGDTCLN